MKVKVSEKEAALLAKQWVHLKDRTDRMHADHSTEYRKGILGELAFAKAFGLAMDKRWRVTGDDGVDFVLRSGLNVDVKFSTKPSHLWVKEKLVGGPADVFVLTTSCGPDEVELVGWAKQADLVDAEWRDTPFGGRCKILPAAKLRKMLDLVFLAAVDAHP